MSRRCGRAKVGKVLISVGLPVYNGDRFLAEAIESVLDQTHDDLELIISDNGSDDRTQEICQSFAAGDSRVRYHRHEENRGAAFNFNFVLAEASGDFFKWMAHDDVCGPKFLEVCLEALHNDPDAVLAYPSPIDIDSDGVEMGPADTGLGLDDADPNERFRRTMAKAHKCLVVFGLMRTDVLRQTCRHGDYPAADRVLIGELALRGKLVEVPQQEFFHREHPQRFSISHKDMGDQIRWFDPRRAGGRNYPTWRRFGEYLRAIARSPLTWRQRLSAFVWMLRWAIDLRSELIGDLIHPTHPA
ncbi:MAG: glycosyltransferase family 2 protein [Acidimicrobiia bacterium]